MSDPLAEEQREYADLLAEWHRTCKQMGLRFTYADAVQFAADAGWTLIRTADRDRYKAQAAALRERIEALRDEWAEAVEPDGGTSLAPVKWMAAELDAALADPEATDG